MAGIILVVSDKPNQHDYIRGVIEAHEYRVVFTAHDIEALQWLHSCNPSELTGIIVDLDLGDNEDGERELHPEFGIGMESALDHTWIRFTTTLTLIAKQHRPVARVIVIICASGQYHGANQQWALDTHPLQHMENVARPLTIEYHDPIGSENWSWPQVMMQFGAMLYRELRVLSEWDVEQARLALKTEEK